MDMTRNEELSEQFRAKAKELVAQMTLDEKVSQTTSTAKGTRMQKMFQRVRKAEGRPMVSSK